MKVQVEPITAVKVKLTVEVGAEQLAREEADALEKVRRSAELPGFRRGKAPLAAVKRAYGDRIRADVIGEAIRDSYSEALRQEDIHPVTDADIEIESTAPDGSLTYVAVVETRPKVDPTGYTGLTLKKEELRLDETAVEARLEAIRQQHASYVPAPEGVAARDGDIVVIDFVGRIDGEVFEGGSAQGHSLILGSGRMIPGFEEGLLGAATGEERVVDVTFPADYRAAELAGKPAKFTVTVKEVKTRNVPALDDELAKEIMEDGTLDALRERVRTALKEEERVRIEREFKRKLVNLLLAANPFEVPESIVSRQQAHSEERMREELSMRGIDPSAAGLDKPAFLDESRRAAERSVRWAFLLDALSEKLGVEATDEDVDARIREIAEADGRPYTAIRAFFDKEGHLDSLKDSVREKKTMDAVLASATVEETSAEEWARWRGEDE